MPCMWTVVAARRAASIGLGWQASKGHAWYTTACLVHSICDGTVPTAGASSMVHSTRHTAHGTRHGDMVVVRWWVGGGWGARHTAHGIYGAVWRSVAQCGTERCARTGAAGTAEGEGGESGRAESGREGEEGERRERREREGGRQVGGVIPTTQAYMHARRCCREGGLLRGEGGGGREGRVVKGPSPSHFDTQSLAC